MTGNRNTFIFSQYKKYVFTAAFVLAGLSFLLALFFWMVLWLDASEMRGSPRLHQQPPAKVLFLSSAKPCFISTLG